MRTRGAQEGEGALGKGRGGGGVEERGGTGAQVRAWAKQLDAERRYYAARLNLTRAAQPTASCMLHRIYTWLSHCMYAQS
jgi:hypothetical protein